MLDLSEISALLGNYEALSCVLFTGGKLGVLAVSYLFESTLNGDSVLLCVLNALYTSYSIGVTLAYALAPEGVVAAVGKNSVAQHSHKREETGIPADGDDANLTRLLCGLIHICEVRGYLCVSVKAVDNVEKLCIFGCLNGQIVCAAAADDENVDLGSVSRSVLHIVNRNVPGDYFYGRGVTAGKYCRKLHIIVLLYGVFNALSEISVA